MDLLIHPRTEAQANMFIKTPSHALAIRGEEGSGKGFMAKHMAASVLGISGTKIDNHPYISLCDIKAGNTGIDEVRQLQNFLSLTVPGNKVIKRAAILENIDFLRHEAQNALLKTLEEPPEDTVIITTFSRRSRVLPTIHSRMQQLNVRPVELEFARNVLSTEFNNNLINKAYYISGGQAGLMAAILNDHDGHELVDAIARAREIIEMSRYQRLGAVDKWVKDKNGRPELLLDGLYRLISAAYKNSLAESAKTAAELKPYVKRLQLLEQAISDLHENVQAKLVFSRLFMEL